MNSRVPSWQQAGSGNANGVRKMVIKPFKKQPKIPDNYEQSTWEKLALAVRAVNSKVAVAISKEELYRVSSSSDSSKRYTTVGTYVSESVVCRVTN